MIFVDSCVWIDFFRGATTEQVEFLDRHSGQARMLTGDLVLAEVLQGFADQREFDSALHIMGQFQTITVSDPATVVSAVRNYRTLRRRGLSIRKTIDTLIATRCLEDDLSLLTSDRDFAPFFAHLGLRDAMVEG